MRLASLCQLGSRSQAVGVAFPFWKLGFVWPVALLTGAEICKLNYKAQEARDPRVLSHNPDESCKPRSAPFLLGLQARYEQRRLPLN